MGSVYTLFFALLGLGGAQKVSLYSSLFICLKTLGTFRGDIYFSCGISVYFKIPGTSFSNNFSHIPTSLGTQVQEGQEEK